MRSKPKNLYEVLQAMSDKDLISILPYVRNADGEKVDLAELKQILRSDSHDGTKQAGSADAD